MVSTVKVNPELLIDVKAQIAAIDEALQTLCSEAELLYSLTTQTWEASTKPKWKKSRPTTVNGTRELVLKTSSTPFVYVDEGTKGPYEIKAKRGKSLKFATGGKSKTFKGSLMSTAGMPGDSWHTAQSVTHPGIEAREFTEEIASRLTTKIVSVMQDSIDKAAGI